MKKIVVATDFTYPAMNALDYAIHLAKEKNVGITLIHASDLTDTSGRYNPIDGDVKLAIQSITEDNFKSELRRVGHIRGNVEIDTVFFVGDIVDALKEKIGEGNVYLSVMGTTGQNKSGLLWGSKSLNAMRNLNGPILLVPRNAEYTSVNKMMLSLDLEKLNEEFPFTMVAHWVKEMKAHLDILNIQPLDPMVYDENKAYFDRFQGIEYNYLETENDDMSGAVARYLEVHNANWIVVVPKKYGFFTGLFHKSKSEIISKASDVPILAIHQD